MGRSRGHDKLSQRGKERSLATRENELDFPAQAEATLKDYLLYDDTHLSGKTSQEVSYEKSSWDETVDKKLTPEKKRYLAIKRFRAGRYIHGAEPEQLEPGQYTIKPNLYIANFGGKIERLHVTVNPPTVPNPLGNRHARRSARHSGIVPESHAQYTHAPPKQRSGPGGKPWTYVVFNDVEERKDFTTLPREGRGVLYARNPGSNYYTVTYSWPSDLVSLERLEHALNLPRLVNKLAVGHRPNHMEVAPVPEGIVPTDDEHYGKLRGPIVERQGGLEVTFYTLKTKNWRRTYHTLPTPDVINWAVNGKVVSTTYLWSTSRISRNRLMHSLNGNTLGPLARAVIIKRMDAELSELGPTPLVDQFLAGHPTSGRNFIDEALSDAIAQELARGGLSPLYNEVVLGISVEQMAPPESFPFPYTAVGTIAALSICYSWFMGHAVWNALVHALNGNVTCYDCDQEGHKQGSPMCTSTGKTERRQPAMAAECNLSVQTTCIDHHHPRKKGKGDGKPKDGAARRFAMKDMQLCDQAGMCVLPGCHYHDARSPRVRAKEKEQANDALAGWGEPWPDTCRPGTPELRLPALSLRAEQSQPGRPPVSYTNFAEPSVPPREPAYDDPGEWDEQEFTDTEDANDALREELALLDDATNQEFPESEDDDRAFREEISRLGNLPFEHEAGKLSDVSAATAEPSPPEHSEILKAEPAKAVHVTVTIDGTEQTYQINEVEKFHRLEGIIYAATLEEDTKKAKRRLLRDATKTMRSCGIEPTVEALRVYAKVIDDHLKEQPHLKPAAEPDPDSPSAPTPTSLVKKDPKIDLEPKWDVLGGKLMFVLNRAGYSPTALKTLNLQTETNMDIIGIPKTKANATRALALANQLFQDRQKFLMDHESAYDAAHKEAKNTELYALDVEEGTARNLFILNPKRWYHAVGRAIRSTYEEASLGTNPALTKHIHPLPNIATRCCEVALHRWMADKNVDLQQLREGTHGAFQPGFSLDLRRWELKCSTDKTYCAVGFTLAQATTWVPAKCGHNELLSIVSRQLLGPVQDSTPESRRTMFELGRRLQESAIAPMPYAQPQRDECLAKYLQGKTPAQRDIILAGRANVNDGHAPNVVAECFVKVEACLAKPLIKSHPRNISGCDRFGTYLYTLGPTYYAYQKAYIQYMFRRGSVTNTLLDVKFVYTGGMSRAEVGDLFSLMELKGLSACEIDLSRCDGHNSAEARNEESTHYLNNGMSVEDRDVLLRDNNFRGRTASGIRFAAGATQASGRPDTSLGTSVRLIFISRVYGAWHAWARHHGRRNPTNPAEAEEEVEVFVDTISHPAVYNDVLQLVARDPTYALQLGDDNVLATPGDACGPMVSAFYRWAGHEAVVTVRGAGQMAWDLTSYCSSYAYRIGNGRRHLDNKIFRTLAKTFVCSNISLTEADMPGYVTGIAKGLTSTWLPVLGDVTKQILSKEIEAVTSEHDRKLNQHKHIQEIVDDVDASEVADHFQTIYGVAPSHFDFVKEIDWTQTGRSYSDPRFGPALVAEGSIPAPDGDPDQEPETITRPARRPRRIVPVPLPPVQSEPTPVLDEMLSSMHTMLTDFSHLSSLVTV